MTESEQIDPYQPLPSDPEDQSPGRGQLIGIVMSALIAGSIVFAATCAGGVIFLGPVSSFSGSLVPSVTLAGSFVAGGIRAMIVARNRIKKAKLDNAILNDRVDETSDGHSEEER